MKWKKGRKIANRDNDYDSNFIDEPDDFIEWDYDAPKQEPVCQDDDSERFDDHEEPKVCIVKEHDSLDKCERCDLFSKCELIAEHRLLVERYPNYPLVDIPCYCRQDRMSCKLMNHYLIEHCGRQYVSDGIGDDFKITTNGFNFEIESNKWKPQHPVFISAQTGLGKNFFIENKVLEYVRNLNLENRTDHKVLIVSNRLALQRQMSSRLHNQPDDIHDQIFPYKKFEDVADVMTYQGLWKQAESLQNKQANKFSRYIYIICDEAHFFTSDATFNPETDMILSEIVTTFADVIRIYMSATPYECLQYINKYEGKYRQSEMGICYHFERNYDYLDIKYYSNDDELKLLIAGSEDKWIVFIDNINKCEKFKGELEQGYGLKGQVLTVSAESKRDETYRRMVVDEKLDKDTKVLVATSVIDNGINLKDRNIKHVVVSDVSRVKCLQMLGRVRIGSEDDRITLYIKRFDEAQIKKRIEKLERQQDAYGKWDKAFQPAPGIGLYDRMIDYKNVFYENLYYNKDWKSDNWFRKPKKLYSIVCPNGFPYPNEIARSLVDKLVREYESILAEMLATDEEQEVTGQKYLEYQLSWFGKIYDRKNDITLMGKGEAEAELIALLESRVDKPIVKDEQDDFSQEFTELWDKAFARQDKNKGRHYGINKMNKLLKDQNIGYSVVSEQGYWQVVKLDVPA